MSDLSWRNSLMSLPSSTVCNCIAWSFAQRSKLSLPCCAPGWAHIRDPAKATATSNLLARDHSLSPLIQVLLFVFVVRLRSERPKTSLIDPITRLLIKQFSLGDSGPGRIQLDSD